LFTNFSEKDSNLHVELGTNAKCGGEGVGTVGFQLESRGSLEVENVFLSISTMEDNGYDIFFQDGQVLIRSKRSNIDSARVHGVKEVKVYRLRGKHVGGSKRILNHGLMSITKRRVHGILVWGVNFHMGRGN
jgi:hypothetical protein